VLVTGSNGFVGSRLTEALVRKGANVVALVRDLKPDGGLRVLGIDRDLVVVQGSVSDEGVVKRIVRQYGVQTCFHLAAQALVGAAQSTPTETLDSNIRGTWVVLEACRAAQVPEVVFASSDKAYGASNDLPYRESHPLLASRPYDASKAAADIVARMFHSTFGLPVAVTRCANIYGGGDLNPSRLIPDVVFAALGGRRPELRSDGMYERDFLYVADAVDAYLTLAERSSEPSVAGEAFNFGTGKPRRIIDVVRLILQIAGRPDLEPVILNTVRRGDEIPVQYADSEKAQRVLGWSAKTSFEDGLRQTIDWYRAYVGRGNGAIDALSATAAEKAPSP
jgi:CDP-glucose 4,6-dehydratase